MAGAFDSRSVTMQEMMDKDPTLDVGGDPDQANGETPSPFERYGEPLPENWIPMYRKTLRTPTRRLKIACIGAGISAMNLAYKIYHERKELNCELVIYEVNEDIGGTVSTSLALLALRTGFDQVAVAGQHISRSGL